VKKLFLIQPTRFSTAPFCCPARASRARARTGSRGPLDQRRVPDDQLALAGEDDGLGIVPDGDERHAAERLDRLEQAAHQRLLALVRHDGDIGEATPLQPAREEAHALLTPVEKADIHMAKIVL